MTGPKIRNDAAIHSELSRTIQQTGEAMPCSGSELFGPSPLDPIEALEAIELCRACPVMAECGMAGRLLSPDARADSVMGGIRYDAKGERILIGQLRKAVRGQVSVAELEGSPAGQSDGIDSASTEVAAA